MTAAGPPGSAKGRIVRSPRRGVGRLARHVADTLLRVALVAATLVTLVPARGLAVDPDAFAITVNSPSVKLGEHAVIVATITTRDGFKITESYRHKIRQLSAVDDGVQLVSKVVNGTVRDGKLIFLVDVVPTKIGTHTVVGFVRFSLHNGQQLDITSAPFEATVTARE
jgi:hypothetical protein